MDICWEESGLVVIQSCSNGIQYLETYVNLRNTKNQVMGFLEKPRFFKKNLGFFL